MNIIRDTLTALARTGNLREIPHGDAHGVTDFSSNDYLGLAADADLRGQFLETLNPANFLPASSASRLLGATQNDYEALEALLSDAYGRPALLFNSGYHANTGMIAALGGKDTLFLADRLVHASIIDGLRLSGSTFLRFRHNDMGHLLRLVAQHSGQYQRVVVVAESVYSMDGDSADIQALTDIRNSLPNCILYIDEAHALGVCGPAGLGRAYEHRNHVDIIMGTFGKALASEGAFAVMAPEMRQFMVNRCRSLIFSTAISPLMARWTSYTFRRSLEADSQRTHLQRLASHLYTALNTPLPSHIQPLIIGDAARTVVLSQKLREDGLAVLPIRTPTVPPGTERLRISLSAALSDHDIDNLISSLTKYYTL